MNNFARVLHSAGMYEEGIAYGTRAMQLAEQAGDALPSGAQLSLSYLYQAVGDPGQERFHLDAALRSAPPGQEWKRAFILSRLGRLDHRTGRITAAVQNLRASIEVYQGISQAEDEAETAGHLGQVLLDHGEAAESVSHLETGQAHARTTGEQSRCTTRDAAWSFRWRLPVRAGPTTRRSPLPAIPTALASTAS